MYVFWRSGRLRAETALLLAGLMAFAIGVSRIYLIEHYLSDVLNGWLIGALWVTVGIATAEWRLSQGCDMTTPLAGRARLAGIVVALGLAVLAAANVWRIDHPRNGPVQVTDQVLNDVSAFAQLGLPVQTESLMGSQVRPVSLVVFARNEAALSDAVVASGWAASQPPTAGLVFDALLAALLGSEDPTVETISHFWRAQPNDLAFVQRTSVARPSLTDPKLRFWRTEFVATDGLRAFIGTVGIDEAHDAEGGAPVGATDLTLRDAFARDMRTRGATLAPPLDLQEPAGAGQTAIQVQAVVLRLP